MQYHEINIKMFPAKSGDCFFIEFIKEDFRILIDGGYAETYQESLCPFLKQLSIKGKHINLIIISHIDQDHINGIKALLQNNGNARQPDIISIDEIWFNGFRHSDVPREQKEIPFYEKNILQMMANQNNIHGHNDGSHDISFAQGDSVAELLTKNDYNWNTSVNGNAICADRTEQIQFGNIVIKILNPTQTILNELAESWIASLRSKCRPIIINDNHLFDDAFEGAYINEHDDWVTVAKEISYNNGIQEPDWENLAEQQDDVMDTKPANCSSIAVLISYNNTTLLFPGDCAIDSRIRKYLPDKIDIVKLPHHGSAKNITKGFIQQTDVTYYLVSTDGKHAGHPSPAIIANILTKSPGNAQIIKNYDIPLLKGIGKLGSGTDD
ncbi:MAG: MBL fold metallo-hydrolase [Ruminococcus flavefaciens]|nr:MBL fold metallo-hydrolase [Ruminococcus flavefaciens]